MTGHRRIPEQSARELAELYRAEASGLFNQARVLTQGDHAGAEDLVQKVFEAAAVSWSVVGCRPDEDRRRWLFTVLRNKAIDEWRAARWTVLDDELVDGELQVRADSLSIGDIVAKAVDLDRVWKELKIMPPARYRVAYLTWRLDWSTKQIADSFGITEATVRVHKFHATRQIQDLGLLRGATDSDVTGGADEPDEGRWGR